MSLVSARYAADSHIGITDGLDLFKVVLLCDPIEMAKTIIQFFNQLLRCETFGNTCEAYEVSKKDGGVVIIPGLTPVIFLKLSGNGLRENIQQKAVGFLALLVQVAGQYHNHYAGKDLGEDKATENVIEPRIRTGI